LKIGKYSILLGAEIDGVDAGGDYVECKLSLYENPSQMKKALMQCSFGGVSKILLGLRDKKGSLVKTKNLTTKDIERNVLDYDEQTYLKFTERVISWLLERTVDGGPAKVLSFCRPFENLCLDECDELAFPPIQAICSSLLPPHKRVKL